MSNPVINNFNELKKDLVLKDCRFSERNGRFVLTTRTSMVLQIGIQPLFKFIRNKRKEGTFKKSRKLSAAIPSLKSFMAPDNSSRPLTSGDHETPLRRQRKVGLRVNENRFLGNTSV
jgi:hypothetical protein